MEVLGVAESLDDVLRNVIAVAELPPGLVVGGDDQAGRHPLHGVGEAVVILVVGVADRVEEVLLAGELRIGRVELGGAVGEVAREVTVMAAQGLAGRAAGVDVLVIQRAAAVEQVFDPEPVA